MRKPSGLSDLRKSHRSELNRRPHRSFQRSRRRFREGKSRIPSGIWHFPAPVYVQKRYTCGNETATENFTKAKSTPYSKISALATDCSMYDGDRNAAIERALTRIFKRGEPAPSADVVFDAYPFSKRKSDPYQRWCSRLTAYRDAHAAGLPYPADVSHRADPTEPAIDRETLDLFGQEG